ncbi:glycosyltransferase, partial [Dyella sp. C9]|uniref:glycosyltransferase n=1 Tax=Dyella sp. C9 TaxID=2202154 RepID=UPI001300A8A7
WLDQAKIERAQPLKVGYFHLGADPEIDAGSRPSTEEQARLDALKSRPTVLMVSTVEPRKGYQQALEAFEQLWQQGAQVNLAIVGKAGWRTESLVERLRTHPEAGHRLHWFEGASDAVLHALYQGSDLLLSASEGEGFGLPVIEAAQYGIPLLLRDLDVFREIAGDHAGYFSGYEASDLASALTDWLEGRAAGRSWPDSRGVEWLTWQQSYAQFLDVLEGRRWAYEVGNTPRYWFPSSDPRMQTQCGVYKRGQVHASGNPGMLIYGPYAKVPDGTYRLRAYGAMDRPDPESWLDVASEGGTRTLFRGELVCTPDGEGKVLLDGIMTLPRPVKDLEIRVWSSGQSQLELIGFELVRQV